MPTEMSVFATALITCISLTPATRQLALRLGMVDLPGPRKLHLKPIPLLGGLAIYIGAILAILLFIDRNARSQIIGIVAGATLLTIVGILDDRKLLHHQVKLMVAMPVAALILVASGIHTSVFTTIGHSFGPPLVWLFADYLLTIFWVVGITAAFSILDHMDGLCTGVAGVASAFFLLFAWLNGQILVGILAAAMLGTSLGFLGWNFNPARIFMGDGGAMFLGFMMATLALKLHFPQMPQTISWMIPVLILGVPVFDTSLISVSRARRGLIPFTSPGKDHTAHRLANLGLGQRGAVLVLYALGVFLGLLALVVSRLSVLQAYVLAILIILGSLLTIVLLERTPYERQQKT
jgi:UDP-GlcNAc:undecaprenyl-phosphate GlcNAc-1-phosphate transferase